MDLQTFYVINLDSRTDRWAQVQADFEPLGVSLVRFPAVAAKPGSAGCFKSHVQIVRNAKERGAQFVVALEDDATPSSPSTFAERWTLICRWLTAHPAEWEVLNGGPSYVRAASATVVDRDAGLLGLLNCGQATHFIAYNSTAFDRVLEAESQIGRKWRDIDIFLMRNFKVIAPVPYLAVQRPSHSDIQGRAMDLTSVFRSSEAALSAVLAKGT